MSEAGEWELDLFFLKNYETKNKPIIKIVVDEFDGWQLIDSWFIFASIIEPHSAADAYMFVYSTLKYKYS